MRFVETALAGAYKIELEKRTDARGFFARAFCIREFEDHGLSPRITQVNIALTRHAGTLRGLHFQFPPMAEAKLVRCTRGSILDVIVDLRPESSTYLRHLPIELNEENHTALYVPERFAHGYQVLIDDTELTYHASEFYSPAHESGIRFDDPRLEIGWPLQASGVSSRDESWPLLADREPEIARRMALHPAQRGVAN